MLNKTVGNTRRLSVSRKLQIALVVTSLALPYFSIGCAGSHALQPQSDGSRTAHAVKSTEDGFTAAAVSVAAGQTQSFTFEVPDGSKSLILRTVGSDAKLLSGELQLSGPASRSEVRPTIMLRQGRVELTGSQLDRQLSPEAQARVQNGFFASESSRGEAEDCCALSPDALDTLMTNPTPGKWSVTAQAGSQPFGAQIIVVGKNGIEASPLEMSTASAVSYQVGMSVDEGRGIGYPWWLRAAVVWACGKVINMAAEQLAGWLIASGAGIVVAIIGYVAIKTAATLAKRYGCNWLADWVGDQLRSRSAGDLVPSN